MHLRSVSIGVASSDIFTPNPFITFIYKIQIDLNLTNPEGVIVLFLHFNRFSLIIININSQKIKN
jgi:hypothetical protein